MQMASTLQFFLTYRGTIIAIRGNLAMRIQMLVFKKTDFEIVSFKNNEQLV